MFYKLIENKRNKWFSSSDCTIKELMQYILDKGEMRDAQLEAIKTYLYLKICCHNQPLWKLFTTGFFNTLDIDSIPLTNKAYSNLKSNKAAVALLEYSRLKNRDNNQIAPALEAYIKENSAEIDYNQIFKNIFYGVNYTDYIFSLPMGAGKTYLMAAFIYLDLYFALNEPDNASFAHNFMVFAPSGLKSSIVPSLKKIKEFEPEWIIPNPTANQLKKLIKFEILDEQKTASKSNLIKNPNAQKINNFQPLEDLIGLVAITNAEKVILDRIDKDANFTLFSEEEKNKIKVANELRNIIAKIPHLAIYIDEVHHASDSDIKLRQVVNGWSESSKFNSVLGFSGTPYLEKTENVKISDNLSLRNTDLANVVYNYQLIKGIGNFLKIPSVKFSNNDSKSIIKNGVTEFLEKYRNTVYDNGTCAKLAIYCGLIETLEEEIYPQVSELIVDYGLDPTECILRYHGGNKKYPQPECSDIEFSSLDTNISKIKIILLVQIGKEGWDCKSLTGVILPQKGVCPTNMVLQTSCRCLRQVTKDKTETALIWLNGFNAEKLNKQLKQQQNISLKEFGSGTIKSEKEIHRYSRMEYLQVPAIDYYQLKVSYQTLVVDESNNVEKRLNDETILKKKDISLIHQQDIEGNIEATYEDIETDIKQLSFNYWLQQIVKGSFNTLSITSLNKHTKRLRSIFDAITFTEGNNTYLNNEYDSERIMSLIRQAFVPRRDFNVIEEVVPQHAQLLQIEKLKSPIYVDNDTRFYPSQHEVDDVLVWDKKVDKDKPTPEALAALELLRAQGYEVLSVKDPHPEREKTYHYLPYHFDSGLELEYFSKSLISCVQDKGLEFYFNGDDNLTEFKIDCFKKNGNNWQYIGKYVPDFLLLNRREDKQIDKVIIIETKGEGFAAKFNDRRRFMETEFIQKNNEKFGYPRFDFLYLEDTISKEEREKQTLETINHFFNL